MAGVGNPAGTVQEKSMAPPEVAELRNAVNPMGLHALVVADSAAKAIGRYEAYGEAGLQGPQQGAPPSSQRHSRKNPVERIIAMQRERLSWGPKTITARLQFIEPAVPWPSSSTAGAILAQGDW